jgi:uroporphyrinogen-III decarboxylase
MTNRERIQAVLNFKKPDDRLPMTEWATWWNLTLEAWYKQGLDRNIPWDKICVELGLDYQRQFWFPSRSGSCPAPKSHGAPIMESEADYDALLPFLYPENGIDGMLAEMKRLKQMHDAGDVFIWFSMDGAFWFPRTLFGIENHLYSFYDHPDLYHRILDDLADFQIRQMEKIYQILTPDFMTIAEDMSYNNGPMLSESCFYEFCAPYYRKVTPYIRARGTKVIVDTDGDVTKMIPWLRSVGVDGVLPLERQAGVDINKIRADYPDFILIGAFDKMSMRMGREAMRAEFERILPVMKSGGFIASVDHQTPPDVSLDDYRHYVKLLEEYSEKAVFL